MAIIPQSAAPVTDQDLALIIFRFGVNYGLGEPQDWPTDPAQRALLETTIDRWHAECAADFAPAGELPPAATPAWLRALTMAEVRP